MTDEVISLAASDHPAVVTYLSQQHDIYATIAHDVDAVMDRACREGDVEKVKELLETMDYDVERWKDEEGQFLPLSPMYMAVKFGHYDIVRLFAEQNDEEDAVAGTTT